MISASHARLIATQPKLRVIGTSEEPSVPFFLGVLDKAIEAAADMRKTSISFRFPPFWPDDHRSAVMVTLRGAGYDVRLLCGVFYALSLAKKPVTEGQPKEGAS